MTEVLMTLQLPTALQEQLYVARSSGDDAQTIQSSQNHDMNGMQPQHIVFKGLPLITATAWS